MDLTIESIQGQDNKNELAYKAIKQSIINNELKPNTMLVERQLSEALNISRTPIRHALMRLANEGFVEVISNKGIFVSEINLADVIEIYSIRAVLEPFTIALCLENNNPETYNQMKKAVDDQDNAINNNNYSEYLQHDLEFHRIYVTDSNNKRLQAFMSTMSDQLERLANTTVGDMDRARKSISQHYKILAAYAEKDVNLVKELIEDHMQDIKQYYINKFLRNTRFST